jgi:MFS family permease
MSQVAAGAPIAARFSSLAHRNFRIYWAGQLLSLVGTWMQSVAQGWLMHRLTGSAFMLGLLGFCQFLPVLLLSLWAGALVDQMDKRRLLFITQSLAMVQAFVLAAIVSSGAARPWMVLVLAAVFGTINAFDLPARQSFLAELVPKADLPNAIALNSAAFNSARILGPSLAGILVATVGEAGCFWINAVSYIAVLWSLSRLDLPRPRAGAASPVAAALVRSSLAEGLRYAFSVRPIRNLLILLGFTAGLGFQYLVLLPVYAREILHGGPQAYGLLVAAFGLGALLSAVRLTQKLDRKDLRFNLLIGLFSSGLGLGVFAWSRALPLSLAAGFVAGFGLIVYVASTNTMLQLTTEDRFRGRVMSLYTLMFIGMAPIGALLAGSIAERYGAPVATTVSAGILLLGAIWVFFRLRVLARREGEVPPAEHVERLG